MGEPQKQEIKEPSVDGIRISARRAVDLMEIAQELAPLPFLKLVRDGDMLVLLHVESRDIAGMPYVFSVTYLRREDMEIFYTIPPGTSPSKRRAAILRYFLNLLSLIDTTYAIDYSQLMQTIEASLKDLSEYASSSYDELFALYDSLKNDYTVLKKKQLDLQTSNDRLSIESMDLKGKNDQLVLRLQKIEAYSDEVLISKIETWLGEHNNEINISEFSKIHVVDERRVEEVLNKMVENGLLRARE